jgi:hypothetical protein
LSRKPQRREVLVVSIETTVVSGGQWEVVVSVVSMETTAACSALNTARHSCLASCETCETNWCWQSFPHLPYVYGRVQLTQC